MRGRQIFRRRYSDGVRRRCRQRHLASDGDLASVTSELLSRFGGVVLDSETTTVSGTEAAGSHSLRSRDLANEVRLSVVDTNGVKTEETTEF